MIVFCGPEFVLPAADLKRNAACPVVGQTTAGRQDIRAYNLPDPPESQTRISRVTAAGSRRSRTAQDVVRDWLPLNDRRRGIGESLDINCKARNTTRK
jgi:hypothetical protein